MASSLMHLYVGNKIVTNCRQITDFSQFYLGCIIPDFAETKEDRWLTHFRSSNIKDWYKNNIDFYRCTVGNVDNNLLLGYVIHNITDAAYDEIYNIKIRDFRFDYDQIKESWWTNDVLPALKKAVPMEINGIDKSIAAIQLQKITDENYFILSKDNPVIVTVNMLDELSSVVRRIVEQSINIRFSL